MNIRSISLIAGGLLSLGVCVSIQAAPITFNTALPVGKDEFILRQQFMLMQSGDDNTGANRDRTEYSSMTAAVYGINSRLSLFGVLPYRDISLSMNDTGQKVNRGSEGIGDAQLFGRYIFQQNNTKGATLRLAAFTGIKIPTGKNDHNDSLGKLPAPVQSGSGSLDGFGGIVITQQTLSYQFDSQISYRLNTEADNFRVGNVFKLDASLQKRAWPDRLGNGVPMYLYGVLESNLVYQGKNKTNGVSDDNSGGTRLFISPGLQIVTRRWIAEGGVQIPVLQSLNGTALEGKYMLRAGIRVNF